MREPNLREVLKLPPHQRHEYNAPALLIHRKAIENNARKRDKWNGSQVRVSQDIPPEFQKFADRNFPGFAFNLWQFERGCPVIEVKQLTSVYGPHIRVDYFTLDQEKSALLKQTPHARFERFHIKLARIVENPSYKILSVDDGRANRGHWEFVQIGWKESEEGVVFPDEDVIPYLPSSYAVVEWIDGEGMDKFAPKIESLSAEQQELLAYNLGRIAGFNLLFGAGTDFKPEHIIVDPNTLDCTRIDHEHAFIYFDPKTHSNMAIELGREDFLLGTHSNHFFKGVRDLRDSTVKNWGKIEDLVLRISRFGAVGYEAKVQPLVLERIQEQIKLLDK